MCYFHPFLGKIPILTNIFQMGWNHQLENIRVGESWYCKSSWLYICYSIVSGYTSEAGQEKDNKIWYKLGPY